VRARRFPLADRLPIVSIGVGNANSSAHAPNENVAVDDFFLGIEWMRAILLSLVQ